MSTLDPIEKDELLKALDGLPPEAVAEVREFIEFQKFKAQTGTQPEAIVRSHRLAFGLTSSHAGPADQPGS